MLRKITKFLNDAFGDNISSPTLMVNVHPGYYSEFIRKLKKTKQKWISCDVPPEKISVVNVLIKEYKQKLEQNTKDFPNDRTL